MREKFPPIWQLLHFFADWCTVWRCHEIREIYSSSSLAETIEFVVLNCFVSVHTALNWLSHIAQRIIPKKYINLPLVSVVAAMAYRPLRDLSRVTLPPLLKRRTHRLTELTSATSSSHTFLPCQSISVGLEPSAVRNSVTTLSLERTFTTSAILHCNCFGRTWLTGVSIILVEMNVVAIRWVRQETIRGVTFKKRWGVGGLYMVLLSYRISKFLFF
jgi:hypothetical protein